MQTTPLSDTTTELAVSPLNCTAKGVAIGPLSTSSAHGAASHTAEAFVAAIQSGLEPLYEASEIAAVLMQTESIDGAVDGVLALGLSEGPAVAVPVGSGEGDVEGKAVGLPLGAPDGHGEGVVEGEGEGSAVGGALGLSVGPTDGMVEGRVDGTAVGFITTPPFTTTTEDI